MIWQARFVCLDAAVEGSLVGGRNRLEAALQIPDLGPIDARKSLRCSGEAIVESLHQARSVAKADRKRVAVLAPRPLGRVGAVRVVSDRVE
jgi:hypothetical protein